MALLGTVSAAMRDEGFVPDFLAKVFVENCIAMRIQDFVGAGRHLGGLKFNG